MIKPFYISLLLILLTFTYTFAEPKAKSNVSAKVYSSHKFISPGNEIIIAVEFKINDQWHIYWENPGDAGMSTTLEYILPDGFEAGKVLYPYPQKFKTEGLTSYGYKKKTVLLTKVKIPNNLNNDTDYKIKIKANWLECKEICIPGEASLELTIRANDKVKSKKFNNFKDYFYKIPKSLNGLKARAEILEHSANLEVKFPDYLEHKSLDFDIFPLNEAIFIHSNKPKIVKENGKFLIKLDFDPFKVDLPDKLEFVLVLDDKNAKIINTKSVYFYVDTKN